MSAVRAGESRATRTRSILIGVEFSAGRTRESQKRRNTLEHNNASSSQTVLTTPSSKRPKQLEAKTGTSESPPSVRGGGAYSRVSSWVDQERKRYSNEGARYKPCSAGELKKVHLLYDAMTEEFKDRFWPVSIEKENERDDEKENNLIDANKCPYLLVSVGFTGVFDKLLRSPPYTCRRMRFEVKTVNETTEALFLACMPTPAHGEAERHIIATIDRWADHHQLEGCLSIAGSVGTRYQPDCRVRPLQRRPNAQGDEDPHNNGLPRSRLVVEVEHHNRSPLELRRKGFEWMSASPYHKLFLGIKMWNRSNSGEFAMVAVLWSRHHDVNNNSVFDPVVLAAVDCGTRTADWRSFASAAQLGELPEVLPQNQVTPQPYVPPVSPLGGTGSPPAGSGWLLAIPGNAVCYDTIVPVSITQHNPNGRTVADVLQGVIGDLVIDLFKLQRRVDSCLV